MDVQSRNAAPIDVQRLHLLLVGIILTGLTLYVATQAMHGGTYPVISALVLVGAIMWSVMGKSAWWVPIPLATALGGLLWVGFRIYTHELAIVLALSSLIPAIAMR